MRKVLLNPLKERIFQRAKHALTEFYPDIDKIYETFKVINDEELGGINHKASINAYKALQDDICNIQFINNNDKKFKIVSDYIETLEAL